MADADPTPTDPEPVDSPDLLVVVGAALHAERHHRPLAYRLRGAILDRVATRDAPDVVVCTDLWYLHESALQACPAIAVGDASSNAATALLGGELPRAFEIEGVLEVRLDVTFADPRACLWGVRSGSTLAAVDLFVERYLDGFLEALEIG